MLFVGRVQIHGDEEAMEILQGQETPPPHGAAGAVVDEVSQPGTWNCQRRRRHSGSNDLKSWVYSEDYGPRQNAYNSRPRSWFQAREEADVGCLASRLQMGLTEVGTISGSGPTIIPTCSARSGAGCATASSEHVKHARKDNWLQGGKLLWVETCWCSDQPPAKHNEIRTPLAVGRKRAVRYRPSAAPLRGGLTALPDGKIEQVRMVCKRERPLLARTWPNRRHPGPPA